jgi:hypothetical protein
MASASIHRATVVHLDLTVAEASWLRALLQNPIGGEDPALEDPWNSEPRLAVFEALPDTNTLLAAPCN